MTSKNKSIDPEFQSLDEALNSSKSNQNFNPTSDDLYDNALMLYQDEPSNMEIYLKPHFVSRGQKCLIGTIFFIDVILSLAFAAMETYYLHTNDFN